MNKIDLALLNYFWKISGDKFLAWLFKKSLNLFKFYDSILKMVIDIIKKALEWRVNFGNLMFKNLNFIN